MSVDFERVIDRRSTSDLKWRPEGLKGYLPITVSENEIPMWLADMDVACPVCVVEAIKERADKEIFGYCTPKAEYYEALKWWYAKRFGLQFEADRVSLMPTVVSAINMAIRAFSEEGDKVIIQQPVYEPFAGLIAKTKRVMVNNGLICKDGHYEMDFELLEKQTADPKAKIFILCSPHNPVGRVWTKEELHRLGEICKKNHVFIVADEIHSDIVFKGNVHTPFPLASDAPHILCTAPGKTFNVAGLRVSNILSSSAEIKKRYDAEVNAYSFAASSTFGIEAVMAAYSPQGEEWLEELLVHLEGNAKFVENWCEEHGVGCTHAEGTFLSWLDFSSVGMSDDDIMKKIIIGQEVVCIPGPWFGEGGKGYLRLNIGCTRKTLTEALDRIASVL